MRVLQLRFLCLFMALAALLVTPISANAAASNLASAPADKEAADASAPKAALQIIAEEVTIDPVTGIVVCSGGARAQIEGQNASASAGAIRYYQGRQIIELSKGVSIVRYDEITSGGLYQFKMASDEYLVTSPGTVVNEVDVWSKKSGESFAFTPGKIVMDASAAKVSRPRPANIYGTYLGFYDNKDQVPQKFRRAGVSATNFTPAQQSLPFMGTATSMPQFAQYRLGGVFGGGARGFRSFSDLGTGSTMLLGTLELRRKLHLPGDNVVEKVLNKNIQSTGLRNCSQMIGNRNLSNLELRTSYGATADSNRIKLPVIGQVRSGYGTPLVGDFPGRGVGLRQGLPVQSLPTSLKSPPWKDNGAPPWLP